MDSVQRWLAPIVRHFEKIIALAMMLFLLGSLLYLGFAGLRGRKMEREYLEEVGRMEPAHPEVAELDSEPFSRALRRATEPRQLASLPADATGLFVPEVRVWCVECRSAIPFEAGECPFCRASQVAAVEDVDPDSNQDGIPDSWYRKYGMDPFDPDIADKDWDGDGFTNRQEFEAGTSPVDPADHPPVDVLLRVKNIEGRSVRLRFYGRNVMPDGSVRCQFNLPTGQTRWLSPGDELEIGGYTFVFVRHETRNEMRQRTGWPEPRMVPVHFALLRSGEHMVELELNVDQDFTEYIITVELPLDGSTYQVRPGHVFTLRGQDYRLTEVDKESEIVVIRSEADGRTIKVSR